MIKISIKKATFLLKNQHVTNFQYHVKSKDHGMVSGVSHGIE